MSSAIQNIMQASLGDGARATKFDVLLNFSNNDLFDAEAASTLVKSTVFPSKSHTIIDFKYKGRSVPLKGQTKYSQTWECTFYLTQDHKLKSAIENWIEALDQKHNYLTDVQDVNLTKTQNNHKNGLYAKNVVLYQLNFDGDQRTVKYELFNVFPIEVSPIQYSYETVGTIQEFTVTFAYSHFSMSNMKGKEGNFIDEIVGGLIASTKNSIKAGASTLGDSINKFVSDNVGDSISKQNTAFSGFADASSGRGVSGTISSLINGGAIDMETKVTDK